jgi:hypothetical protein
VAKWTRQKGFKISPEKTVCMHICRKRTHNQIQLNGRRLEINDTHKILGLTFDSRFTWKTHINETKAKSFIRINLLKCQAGMKWGADLEMLLRLHEMMVLSALEYGSAAYGSASNAQLKRLQPVHNKGLRIALGAFCVCRIENIMCESGFESLDSRAWQNREREKS